jgi:uncharacterized protein
VRVLLLVGLFSADAAIAAETSEQRGISVWQAMHTATLRVERPDASVSFLNVRVADDAAEREQGMQYLSPAVIRSNPIWFVFPEPLAIGWHMQNVRLALDIAWVDTDGRVVDVQRMTPSQHATSVGPPARYALEVAAGEARRLGIQPGARLSLITDKDKK